MPNPIASSAEINSWIYVLDQVQTSIAEALRHVDDREKATASGLNMAADCGNDAIRESKSSDKRLPNLEAHLALAEDSVAQVEELLSEDEREISAWLKAAEAFGQTLVGRGQVGI